jgi:TatD DNase family protein
MIVDSHCHLNMLPMKGDVPAVLERAQASGIELLQTICTSLEEFEEVVNIADTYPQVFASVGVHPNHVTQSTVPEVDMLVKLAGHKKVIGLGETGLDYYRGLETAEFQKKSFLNHIEASRITGLPVIIHAREAEADIADILKAEMRRAKFKALLHCFTGSSSLAELALELGLYISISGIVTFKNAKPLQEIVKSLPLARLLVETDSPYLAPVPFRGKSNEPALLKHTVNFIGQLLDKTSDEIAAVTTQNFMKLFSPKLNA